MPDDRSDTSGPVERPTTPEEATPSRWTRLWKAIPDRAAALAVAGAMATGSAAIVRFANDGFELADHVGGQPSGSGGGTHPLGATGQTGPVASASVLRDDDALRFCAFLNQAIWTTENQPVDEPYRFDDAPTIGVDDQDSLAFVRCRPEKSDRVAVEVRLSSQSSVQRLEDGKQVGHYTIASTFRTAMVWNSSAGAWRPGGPGVAAVDRSLISTMHDFASLPSGIQDDVDRLQSVFHAVDGLQRYCSMTASVSGPSGELLGLQFDCFYVDEANQRPVESLPHSHTEITGRLEDQ